MLLVSSLLPCLEISSQSHILKTGIVTDGLYDSSDSDISMKQVDLTNVENLLYEMKC